MIPDIVEIKRLCASGQWFAKIENGRILLHDTVAGETVCIGKVDAKPERHGKWKQSRFRNGKIDLWTPTYECSECHYILFGSPRTNFCPNCGAKMDTKEDG